MTIATIRQRWKAWRERRGELRRRLEAIQYDQHAYAADAAQRHRLVSEVLQRISAQLGALRQQGENAAMDIMEKLGSLAEKVAAEKTVIDSGVLALNGLRDTVVELRAELATMGVPQSALDKIDELGTAIDEQTASLSAAIPQNTAAADESAGAATQEGATS